jgi:hypothetical integral membrane protein (TIGR02206 family)
MKTPFQIFSSLHLLTIAGCVVALVLLFFYAKNIKNQAKRKRDAWIFTIIFLLIEVALIGSKIIAKEWSIQQNLPLHLCDISAFTILIALHTQKKSLYTLGFFWGFTGGVMAILLPNLLFVDWYYLPFFIWHLFLIAIPMYQMLTDKINLSYRSIFEAMLYTILLGGLMLVINRFLHSNYMFVSEKIPSFDALGFPAHPYYLIHAVGLGLIVYHLAWFLSKLILRIDKK